MRMLTKVVMVALVGPEPGARLALTLVSLIAGVNGALVHVVMASGMAYGMACQGNALCILRRQSFPDYDQSQIERDSARFTFYLSVSVSFLRIFQLPLSYPQPGCLPALRKLAR